MYPQIKLAIYEKNKLYKKFKRYRSNEILVLRLYQANAEVSRLNTFKKNKYYQELVIPNVYNRFSQTLGAQ